MARVPFLRDTLIEAGLSPEDADTAVDAARLHNDARIAELMRMVDERNAVIAAVRGVRLHAYSTGWDAQASAYAMKHALGQALGLETNEEIRENPADVRYPDLSVEFNKL